MKELKDYISLEGEIERISMTEFRSKPGEILLAVELGKTFIIQKSGKSIAVLSKLPGIQLDYTVDEKGYAKYVTNGPINPLLNAY